MTARDPALFEQVKSVLLESLQIEDRADSISPETRLFGSLPELDSLAVVELLVELENRFGLAISEETVTAENFETVAALVNFVAQARS